MAKRRRSALQTVNEINVTPLMDLTFLLLIVFMITAPMMEYETNVTPPSMSSENSVKSEDDFTIINLTAAGEILVHGKITTLDELITLLAQTKASSPAIKVGLRADQSRPYKEIVDIMKAGKKAGFNKISLITQEDRG